MTWPFLDERPGVSPQEISAYEAGAGIRFPPQYRAFLQKQNGGTPGEMITVTFSVSTDIACFFQLYRKSQSDRLPDLSGRVGPNLIWFAQDSGGGTYGIAHIGQSFGKVFWVDLPHCGIDWPEPEDCVPVRDSFEGFVTSIQPLATKKGPAK